MNFQTKRMVAGLIDVIIVGTASASLFAFLYSIVLLARLLGLLNGTNVRTASTFTVITLITLYETICLNYGKGSTVGKMVMGLRVVSIQNETKDGMDIYTCFLRSLVKAIMMVGFSGIFFVLNVIFVFIRQTPMMAYDYIAQTTMREEGRK